jgi:hypothetical protein
MSATGRPSKFKPEYCERLIQHMSEGLSFRSFAGEIDVCFDTLYEWEKVHKIFSDAKRLGVAKSLLTWERIGLADEMSTGTYCFNMKNRFPDEWKDRHDVVQQTTHKSDDSVLELAEKLAQVLKLASE